LPETVRCLPVAAEPQVGEAEVGQAV